MSLSANTYRRIVWTLRVLLGMAFGAAGAAKLAGATPMVQTFDLIGIGQWFRVVTGIVEVGGAVLLLVPAAGFFGSLLLCVTMASLRRRICWSSAAARSRPLCWARSVALSRIGCVRCAAR